MIIAAIISIGILTLLFMKVAARNEAFVAAESIPAGLICDVCNGSGKIGCTNYCDNSEVEKDLCRRNHTCTFCKGYGRVDKAVQDLKDAQPADPSFRWRDSRPTLKREGGNTRPMNKASDGNL